VAAHLRASFAGDGEEMADVIARHYLDALNALPEDPDAAEIRARAATALVRAGERAERTGAPARAATSYATAAQLIAAEDTDDRSAAGALWERAAHTASTAADYAAAVEHAGLARKHYLRHGQHRAAARAQAIAGQALRTWGRHVEAREQLTAAMEVLRTDPDTDTILALTQLAMLETVAGSPDADRLTAEALTLGQALDVGSELLSDLLLNRGIYHAASERRPQAVAYLRESVRLATQTGDSFIVGRALINLSDALAATDPVAAADAARTAAGHLRRTGAWTFLAVAILNLAGALMQFGDWDTAEAELSRAWDSDGRGGDEYIASYRGWLAAMRGDTETAQAMLAALDDMRASEDAQDQAMISLAEAFTAAGRQQPSDALRHARAVLAHADAVGISYEGPRWAWPLAVRAAHDLGNTAAVGELLALLDSYQPGHLAPMLRAERDLVRARLAANDDNQAAAGAAFAAAIARLREQSTPYHLAHGLLDHAKYLLGRDDAEAAALAVEEARDIGVRLRCQPLLDRAAGLDPVNPKTLSTAPLPG
jgi:tetratricopeptide (TPR) repeat protein